MRLPLFALCLLALATLAVPAHAQSSDDTADDMGTHMTADMTADMTAVRAVIDQLFDGMRAGDSTMVRAVFHPSARLVSTFERDGIPGMRESPISQFVHAVGTPHDAVWDERIWDVKIDVDDHLASAWVPYAFFLGDEFSHCGVNSILFANTPDGWKIINLADTRRRGEACDVPEDIR